MNEEFVPGPDIQEDRDRFAVWLKNELATRKMSQLALSKITKISKTTIDRYVHGEHLPIPENIKKIAGVFEIPVSEVLSIAGEDPGYFEKYYRGFVEYLAQQPIEELIADRNMIDKIIEKKKKESGQV
jgi:transcriptional regulator with XRE-family HTH domain